MNTVHDEIEILFLAAFGKLLIFNANRRGKRSYVTNKNLKVTFELYNEP